MRNGTRASATFLTVVLWLGIAVACGASDQAAEQLGAHTAAPEATGAVPGSASGGGGGAASEPGVVMADVLGTVPRVGPSIIKTARLELKVERGSFPEAFGQAADIAEAHGGFVESSATRGSRSDSGSLTMRVPVDEFEGAMEELRALGEVRSESLTGRDVTSQFVDLDARIRNFETQEELLLGFLREATTIAASLQVQRTLSDVQLQIEELIGQRRMLQSRADYSTIHVEMFEGEAPDPIEAASSIEQPRLDEAFGRAKAVFLGVIYTAIVALGVLIPLAVVAGVVWLVVRRVRSGRVEVGEASL